MGKFLLIFDYLFSLVVVVILVFTSTFGGAVGDDEYCRAVTRCSEDGPTIRFPFRLKHHRRRKTDYHCEYPSGLEVSCGGSGLFKTAELEFQHRQDTSVKGLQLSYYVKTTVDSIDYANQRIYIQPFRLVDMTRVQVQFSSVPDNSSPFRITEDDQDDYPFWGNRTFFNCSSTSSALIRRQKTFGDYYFLSSLSGHDFQVHAFHFFYPRLLDPIISCTKVFSISLNARDKSMAVELVRT